MAINIDFTGRTVLITGATKGIGAAMANDFYNAGASLILTGTDSKQIDELNMNNLKKNIHGIEYIQTDFSDDRSLRSFLEFIKSCSKIDVCINNAGTNRIEPIDLTTPEDYDFLNNVNLRAPFLITGQVSRLMKKLNYGRIINIASIWSVISKPGRSIYSATKAGLVGMTKAAAAELGDWGILVNSVSPGFTMTELTKKSLSGSEIKDLSAQIPLKRFALPEEISKLVLFLASDLNGYITGQNIVIDGGFVNV